MKALELLKNLKNEIDLNNKYKSVAVWAECEQV